mgnify:CR=1 FL=1
MMRESELIKNRLSELENEFKESIRSVEGRLEEVRDLLSKAERARVGEAIRALKSVRRTLRALRRRVSLARSELKVMLRRARLRALERPELKGEVDALERKVEDFTEYWRGLVEDFIDDVNDMLSSLGRLRGRMFVIGTGDIASDRIEEIVDRGVRLAMASIEAMIKSFEEALEKFEKKSGPTRVVSSIRLPESDLEIIDLLIEAGAFRSRSEAVAYFTHKGIEASRPTLEGLLNKLRELKEIRDKVREEIKRALEEESEGRGQK